MPVVPVVLDSCVIFPMPLCDTLLRAVEANLYRVHFPQEILNGTTRNLVEKGRITEAKAVRFQAMYELFPDSIIQVIEQQSQDLKNPPLNITELLDKLDKQVPKFASKVWLTIQNLED